MRGITNQSSQCVSSGFTPRIRNPAVSCAVLHLQLRGQVHATRLMKLDKKLFIGNRCQSLVEMIDLRVDRCAKSITKKLHLTASRAM